ncbi:MAG TPA: hypothetical protein IAC41_04445, partial [Candidatus Merdenecus merdavium]|nr:hypothetical protein [Candidatus Merdenecus merdavium]
EYEYDQFESISAFAKRHQREYAVDDITWNDLNMDHIFMLLNHTQSSVGQEYLYHVLRNIELDDKVLKKRDRLATYMEEHSEDRIKLQEIFANLGRTKSLSISYFLYRLEDIEEKSNFIHHITNALILLSIIGMLFWPAVFVIPFLCIIGFSIAKYYSYRGDIGSYIISLSYVLSMLKAADQIEGLDMDGIKEYQDRLKDIKNHFSKFRKNAFLLYQPVSGAADPVAMVLEYIKIIFHVDIIKFNSMVRILKEQLDDVDQLMENLGEMEVGIAIASFRQTLPYTCKPHFIPGTEAKLHIKDAYHPMISDPVANSIQTDSNVLITGSNASGKSTFLKTVAINSILAQSIYTVLGHEYESPFYRIFSSMALRDDLENQESYYIVEIKSLKRIMDASYKEDTCMLCFIDEVLRGTNTIERIAASSQILRSFSLDHVTCFAATHDIELTHLLEGKYENYHFQEEVKKDDVLFDYVLYEGRATSRNAIKLLSIIGYHKEIIEKADDMAERFIKTGSWEL